MNDEVTEEKEKTKGNGSKKKRIAIIIIIALIAIIAIIAIVTNVTISSTAGDDTENLATLKVSSDGSYELTVVNYASSDVGEQNFTIQKTDEYSNPLEGVEFEIVGNFRTSYSVEYLKASDDEGTNFEKLDEYTQVFYDSCWDERYFTTDSNGNISLTLQYGDYVVAETGELYGYDKNDTNYCIRVDKSGISLIDEEDVSWEDPNFDEESVLRVRTASIEDQIGNIGGVVIDYIEINEEKIGTEIDDLPETVEDGDIIRIYFNCELTAVTVTISWEDYNDALGTRPDEVEVYLLCDGMQAYDNNGEAITVTLSAREDWTATFTNLPKYRDGGVLIEYTAEAEHVDLYKISVGSAVGAEGTNITLVIELIL